MLEDDILYNAVENLKKWVHLPIKIGYSNDRSIDGTLKIGNTREYHVEVKREVHKSNLHNVLDHLSKVIRAFPLVVAKSISKSAKEILKKESISYIDMAGNCFIKNDEGLYIQIEGKKLEGIEGKKKHVAFNKNGIKLIYAFLLYENLVNQTYDVMATTANISKSTIGNILKDLKERQFLIQLNRNVKKLNNKQELLERWIQAYNEKLKPSLFRGRFRFLPNKLSEWKNMDLGVDTFWGGEPAADIITDYLSPGEWTIYSKRSKNDLIKNLHLVPDPKEGNVNVYNIFWNLEEDIFDNYSLRIVNPLLVYADLIGTNDNRNFETARKLYERELSTYFTDKITDDVVIEILNAIIPVFKELGIGYFIVGAFARDIGLLVKGHEDQPVRKTNDLDLAVMVSSEEEFKKLKEKLTKLKGIEEHPTRPYKLLFEGKYEIDLLPFGKIEDEKGDIKLEAKKTVVLNMPGFSQVHNAVQSIKTKDGLELNFSSLAGVVFLKLIAWQDKPGRVKDIQDIEYVLRNLYILEAEKLVETDVDLLDLFPDENKYFNEVVSARYLGRKIGQMVKDTPNLVSRIIDLLTTNIHDTENSPMGKIMSFDTLEESIKIITQLKLGIEDTLNTSDSEEE